MNEPTNKVTATIESARLATRKEGGPRMFAVLSFPIRGNEHLMSMVASQLQNPVDITFQPIQPELAPLRRGAPETEETTMVVNGEPAKVRRDRRNDRTPAHEDGGLVGDTAASLIEEARRAPADEEEAVAQREAEARLAARNS